MKRLAVSDVFDSKYNGPHVHFSGDAWFNATEAAEYYGKKPNDWLRLDSTKDYIGSCCGIAKCVLSSLLKTKRGKSGGTWMHPRLAIPFARWLNPEFAVWCDIQVESIIKKAHPEFDRKRMRHEAAVSFKLMNSMLQLQREDDGKKTKAHHYMNEARLVNSALTGEFKSVDRESLTYDELDTLAKLEMHNTRLIGRSIEYKTRKETLLLMAEDLREKALTLTNLDHCNG